MKTHETSRIQELVQDVTKSDERSDGHIGEYLKVNPQFKDHRTTRTGIEHGIKLLVFEHLHENTAVSSILFLKYGRFRRVKFRELARLKKIMTDAAWIPALIKQLSWFDDCQHQYDGMLASS